MDVIVKESKIEGKGVFAAKDFKKGEIVLTWHPKSLTKDEFDNLSDQETKYRHKEGSSYSIMQPPERYVNHSCDPNTKPDDISDIAIREIKQGEEITSDYSGLSNPNFVCNCGSDKCVGYFTENN
jgi:SET domain-containing protein